MDKHPPTLKHLSHPSLHHVPSDPLALLGWILKILCASALNSPALWLFMVYRLVAEPLLPLDTSITQKYHFQLTGADKARQKIHELTCGKGGVI